MTPDLFRKLSALGLSNDQMAGVLEIMDAQAEERKEKGRARWRKWKDNQPANVSKRLSTTANVNSQLAPDPARVEDNLLRKEPTGRENKKEKLLVHSHPERDFFAEFWLAYPRRDGPNPKKPAKLAFDRLVAKGADPERIIEAARALARDHPNATRFVPQAVTWLNQERFGDADPVITGDEFCASDWPNTRFLALRFKNERGHDPPAAVQGGKAGVLIPAEWVALSRNASNVGLVESRS